MKQILPFLFLFVLTLSYVQAQNRIEIGGKILAKTNEVEGVTIYNRSSNKGTITNKDGEFTIEVGLYDKLEISALQFKPAKITIAQTVIKDKFIKVFMVDELNTLDEVIILPYNLTGNLVVDVEEVDLVDPIQFSFGDFSNYEFSDDHQSRVENIAINKGTYYNGFDLVKIAELFIKPKRKNRKGLNNTEVKYRELTDVYTHKLISTTFNVPIEKVEAFIVFVEGKGLTQDLLLEKNGMLLIQFLLEQKEAFLKS